ncbi:LuxR C-terminal-related transcriptional regulator, partial [Mycobacterium heidelbergense]|uniref:LuxR C-terminal-related transcriptional regulator n=1 Tax=Mycobacterium heidelbergense TaxID=53376 RepID=UPI003CF4D6D0
RLSAFAPGYDVNPEDLGTTTVDVGAELEAIKMVCADDMPIQGCDDTPSIAGADHGREAVHLARTEIGELLARLVEQSLVSVHISADGARYSLLESLRLFAEDRLAKRSTADVDEPARLARRHRHYYRDKVLRAQLEWFSPAEQDLLTWAIGAWSNIRRAIDTSMPASDPIVGLQICVGMLALRAPFYIGSLTEIRNRIEQTLAASLASGTQQTELQRAALALTAWLALIQGCPQDGEELLERCVVECNAGAARGGRWHDQPETDVGLPAVVDYAWGAELLLARRDPRAIAVFARAREKFHAAADRGGEAMSEMFEAMAAGFYGSAQQAMSIGHRHLERTTGAGAKWARAWAQMMLAIALTKHGDAEEALKLGRAALTYQVPLGDQRGTTWAVHIRVWSLARLITDRPAGADAKRSTSVKLASEIAYLAGGLKTQRARLGMGIENMGPFADEMSAAENVAREVLGPDAYADLETRGSRLSPEHFELQRVALGALPIDVLSRNNPATKVASNWHDLSKAEQEVAILAAAGWPNSAIGVRRGTSTKTTDAHMSSILQKLVIKSREDIVRFVPQDLRHRISQERSHILRNSPEKPRSSVQRRPRG